MRVAHLPQRHGINQIDVARDECGERLLGIAPGIFPQQGQVVIHGFTHTFTLPRKGNRLFLRQRFYPAKPNRGNQWSRSDLLKVAVDFKSTVCQPVWVRRGATVEPNALKRRYATPPMAGVARGAKTTPRESA